MRDDVKYLLSDEDDLLEQESSTDDSDDSSDEFEDDSDDDADDDEDEDEDPLLEEDAQK